MPAGSITISPFESEVIEPSAVMFKSAIDNVAGAMLPDTTTLPVVVISAVVNVPVMSTFSARLIAVESDESSVVPFTLNALNTTSPVPLGWMLISAFDPFDEIAFVVTEPAVIVPSTVAPPLKVVKPVTPSVVLKLPDVPVKAPVISTASAIVTEVESDESSVVPFTLKALITTSPVPLGCIEISAFEPFEEIALVVTEFAVNVLLTELIQNNVMIKPSLTVMNNP